MLFQIKTFEYIAKCNEFLWWQSWIFSIYYSSLPCHMFLYVGFVAQETIIIISVENSCAT